MATAKNQQKDFPTAVSQTLVTNSRRITHLTIWNESGRTNRVGTLDITDSAVVTLGQTVRLPANIITFTVPTPANGTAFAAQEACRGIVRGGLYVDAHYGNPGSSGTSNRLSELGQANITESEWTIA